MPTKKKPAMSGPGRDGSKLLETLTGHKLNHTSQVKGQGIATRAKHRQKISQGIFDALLPSLKKESS